EGTALELFDCAFPLLAGVDIYDDPAQAFDGVNVAMLVGARPRGKGMERADLLEANGAIFKPQGEALNEHAADDIRILVVGNPAPEIIEARGASSAASAANAAVDHVHDWVLGADGLRSMAVRSGGQYGVEEGLMSSFPVLCSGGDYEIVEGLEVNDFARSKI